ncbi:MAG: glycyl-radical enzyme activating protein [Holophagales bacterium]|nr:glycyl-radical enzyme activating protein [Holophagales bacterium]MBK9966663.1 glycyl-radical enzyme activating protein [Holophagales bacterium]
MAGESGQGGRTGTIFNVQRGSFHDGPGIRTTVFLKGCPLRCPWCHNPEGISPAPEVLVSDSRCLSCGSCEAACPRPEGPLPAGSVVGRDGCLACRACVEACPSASREVAGRTMTVAEVLAEILRDRPVYEESGGGVTFSGGEPLGQPIFLLAALEACRREGLHATVDTCGFAPRETVLGVATQADLFLWDVKTLDPQRHLALTGVPLEPILANLAAVTRTGVPIWLRIPVIPGVNDDEASIARAAALATRTPSVRRVSLLPYHRTANGKRDRLGRGTDPARGASPTLADAPSPTPERMAALAALFAPTGIETTIGG